MREITKPSTAQCNLDLYTLFLLSEPKLGGCSRLAEILGDVSHDSVNRFLLRERYEPKDLFNIIEKIINLAGGILSVDDTVIEKIYSNPKNAELIGYFWSGKAHKTIIGLNLITLYYSDINGNSVPINYRIYDKKEEKTKNDYFREMVSEIISWGVKPRMVTGDSWYSGVENLKFLKNQKLGFLFGIEKNRTVSNEPRKYCQVITLAIPEEGLRTHLKEFGFIKLFRKDFKKEDSRRNRSGGTKKTKNNPQNPAIKLSSFQQVRIIRISSNLWKQRRHSGRTTSSKNSLRHKLQNITLLGLEACYHS